MLSQLQEKQRRLISAVKNVGYVRKEYSIISSNERFIALIGARGLGKTTLLLQYLSQYDIDDALYFSADDISIVKVGIYEIVEEFYRLGGRVVVIDEVHRFSAWASHLKNVYDFFPDMTIRISGSSMLNIVMQSHDLSRRVVIKELAPLTFREYFEIKNSVILPSYTLEEIVAKHSSISYELTQMYPTLYREFKAYLEMGCYPYFITSADKENYYAKLYNSIEKIIYEDIPSTSKIRYESLNVFKKLIYIIVSARVPYKVVIDSLAKELDISEPTLYVYLDLLNKTGIFKSLKKISKKTSRKPEKLFFSNTNILYTVSKEVGIETDIGTVRETFFANACKGVYYSDIGDFAVDDYLFEVGGKNKDFSQIKDLKNSFLVLDIDTSAHKHKIPLWLFGFTD